MNEVKGWTSLRAFAAVWIVLFHFIGGINLDIPVWIGVGTLAVDLFFVLSGFVIGYIYLQKVENTGFSYRIFLWKRFARLYPVFLATTIGYALLLVLDPKLDGHLHERLNGFYVLINAAMLQSVGILDQLTLNYPSWSISAEMFAYLLFPLMAMGILAWKKPTAGLLLALGSLIVFSSADYLIFDGLRDSGTPDGNVIRDEGINIFFKRTYDVALLRVSFEFFLGLSFYHYLQKTGRTLLRRFLSVVPTFLIVVLSFASLYLHISLISVVLFALLIASVFVRGVDCGRAVNYIGTISYSIYMGHALVQMQFYTLIYSPGFEVLRLIAGVGVAIGFGALLYHFIEQPFRHALVTGRANGGVLRVLIGQYRAMLPGGV